MADPNQSAFFPPPPAANPRWSPCPQQLKFLEELYRQGTRTPSSEQIQFITEQLSQYGKIEGKNVFYWFQNHKSREQKKRRRHLEFRKSLESDTIVDHLMGDEHVRCVLSSNSAPFEDKSTSNREKKLLSECRQVRLNQLNGRELWPKNVERKKELTITQLPCPPAKLIESEVRASNSVLRAATPAATSVTVARKPLGVNGVYVEDKGDFHTLQLFPTHNGAGGDVIVEEKESRLPVVAGIDGNFSHNQFFEFFR